MNATDPTQEQAEWLKENYRQYSNSYIAGKFHISSYRLSSWLKSLGLRKIGGKGTYSPKRKISRVQLGPPPSKMKRPRADHTNISREQHVERILNAKL